MTNFHPEPEAVSNLPFPTKSVIEDLMSLSLYTKASVKPEPRSPFDAAPIIEPGRCICRVSFSNPSRYPVAFRSQAHKRVVVCWLGYDDLAGYGDTHNGMNVYRIVESVDSVTSKRSVWAEPKAPAQKGNVYCYGGEVLEPVEDKWPFDFRLQLHDVLENLDRYKWNPGTKEENDEANA